MLATNRDVILIPSISITLRVIFMSKHIEPTIGRSVWYRGKDNAIRAAIITHVWSLFLVNLQVFGKDQNDTEAGIHTSVTHGDIEHEPSCCPSWSWMPYQKGQAAKTEQLEQKLCSGSVGCDPQVVISDASISVVKPSLAYCEQTGSLCNAEELAVEQQIQAKGLNAPRLTPADIDSKILGADYHRFNGTTVTICCLYLANGFTVTGESACASPENFDEEIGRKIARENAREKIWQLEGYLLRQRLHDEEMAEAVSDTAGDYNPHSTVNS
jgi:hypothetical protein